MAVTLQINQFSCIKKARMEISPLTVIIGPQASGKSVISKLTYFFINLWLEQFASLENDDDLAAFKENVKERFIQTFPITAWGSKKFTIDFTAGEWSVKIARSLRRGRSADSVNVAFSELFEDHYSAMQSRLQVLKSKRTTDPNRDLAFLDYSWELREASEKVLQKKLGKDFFQYQLFVPAGRSFFTNAGKAVMLLEQGNMVDPFIARFGRIYANAKERIAMAPRLEGEAEKNSKIFSTLAGEVLGGSVKRDRASEYLEAEDGRKIPFMVMSSGQQELLPLVIALKYWSPFNIRRGGSLIYIEEPEAHLFPSAQSKLVEMLSLIVNAGGKSRNFMVVTTHSPYVLSKLNNLIRAGSLSELDGISISAIEKVIPSYAWLKPDYVKAYALEDGVLVNIMDESGLIDGEYLDRISGDISEEFNRLLSLEFADQDVKKGKH